MEKYIRDKYKSNEHICDKQVRPIIPLDSTHTESFCVGDRILIPINNKNIPIINTFTYQHQVLIKIKHHGTRMMMDMHLNPSPTLDARFKKIPMDSTLANSIKDSKCVKYPPDELAILTITYMYAGR